MITAMTRNGGNNGVYDTAQEELPRCRQGRNRKHQQRTRNNNCQSGAKGQTKNTSFSPH